jgi:hypothetical protein
MLDVLLFEALLLPDFDELLVEVSLLIEALPDALALLSDELGVLPVPEEDVP